MLRVIVLALVVAHAGVAAAEIAPREVPADARIERYQIAPDRLAEGEHAVRIGHVIYLARAAWGIAVLLVVLRLRLGARLQRWTERRVRLRWLEPLVFAPILLVAIAALNAPIDAIVHAVYASGDWLGFATGELFGVAPTVAAIVVLAPLVRWSPRRWWLWAWPPLVTLVLAGGFLGPRLELAFGDVAPIADVAIADRFDAIARHAGVELARDHIVIASSPLPDARVFGMGPGRLVIVNAGALVDFDDRELAFLFAHELGHIALHHDRTGVIIIALGSLVGLFALARGTARIVKAGADQLAALPVYLLVIAVATVAFTPVRALAQRHFEHEADAFGIAALAGIDPEPGQAAAHEFQRLGEIVGLPPDTGVLDLMCGVDHPSIGDRVAFAVDQNARVTAPPSTKPAPTPAVANP